ncbi:MAG: penicillin-binding protein [Pseudonocardiales bacterium]|jgi:peptidoglycan glycosyltransferase|nr:penicillin-binding protein [Pseudonocardiales bacterium]
MNRPIRKVGAALGVLLTAIFVNLNFVQVVKGGDYRNDPNNRRVLLAEYSSPRGPIVVQGTAAAKSIRTSDELKYLRVYPQGPIYAPVTGYNSFIYGTSGLENAENNVLSGDDPRQFGRQLADIFTGRNPSGGRIELTLNKAAQEAAYNAMKLPDGTFKRGAVVALDPTTGAVLAAVSTPSYDPNKLSSHDSASISKYYESLQVNNDPADPMLNRAFNQTYAPGSVFKVIVSAAALKAGVKPDQQVPAPVGFWPFGGSGACPNNPTSSCVENFNGETCASGPTATLAFALAKSCNTAFAALAVTKLGGRKIADEAQLFGFDGNTLQIPLGVAASTVGPAADLADKGALSHISFGQQSVRMTPLQGAMISAAVANGGSLMKPYLVQKELSSSLSVLSDTQPTQLSQVLDPTLDQQLQTMMEGVVTSPEGTGGAAAITDLPGVVVGGKTGTADTGIFKNGTQTPPHAWFSGFALQNGDPKIAVAVIIENGGVNGNETTGGLAAAPVAKAVMEAYLRSVAGH